MEEKKSEKRFVKKLMKLRGKKSSSKHAKEKAPTNGAVETIFQQSTKEGELETCEPISRIDSTCNHLLSHAPHNHFLSGQRWDEKHPTNPSSSAKALLSMKKGDTRIGYDSYDANNEEVKK